MNRLFKLPTWVAACVGCVGWSVAAQTVSSECEQAWTNYNEFKQHNVMEPSQYALTVHGAAVRAACGQDALPVPPGTDIPHRAIVRKPGKPPKPPGSPIPPKPN